LDVLSNQRELLPFFSPWQVNLKISHHILPSSTMPEDDLPRMAKSQKTSYRVWPNPGLQQARISKKEDLMKPAA
jgi:hypothetical protein